jgi:uncharacterized RDD family membrane protein YckC
MQRFAADLATREDRATARRIRRIVVMVYSSLALALCVSVAVHAVLKPATMADAPEPVATKSVSAAPSR